MESNYEELRAATFQVLSQKTELHKSNLHSLKIEVGKVLDAGRGASRHPGASLADQALDPPDRETFRELIWDLFRDGIITPGHNDNLQSDFPSYTISWAGIRMIKDGETFMFYDLPGFVSRIRQASPNIDDVTLGYMKEALHAYRSSCFLSSSVMIGVAAEHSFDRMTDVLAKNPETEHIGTVARKPKNYAERVEKFRSLVNGHKDLFRGVADDIDSNFFSILSIVRNYRNDAGHPRLEQIQRQQAFVNIEVAVHYLKKVHAIIGHFSRS